MRPQEHTNYELQGTGRTTRAPVAQTLQSVRHTCPCTTATCSYLFARFPSCGIFTPTRTIPVKQQLEPPSDGAGETSRTTNYELQGTGRGNTRAGRTNTAKRAPNMLMHHTRVLVPVCTISILWNSHTNPYQSSETTSRNNRVTVPVKPQQSTNYELQGTGWATRAPVAQTLQSVRQTCPCTTATCLYTFARFPSCGIFIPTRTIPVKITS